MRRFLKPWRHEKTAAGAVGGRVLNEADTRTRFIPLKRQLAGREQVPHSIGKQCVFTNGRIMVFGNRAMQTILQKQQPLLLLPSILDKGFRGEL